MNQNLNDIHSLTMENYDPFTGGKNKPLACARPYIRLQVMLVKQGLCPHMKNSRLRAVPKTGKLKVPIL